MLQGNDLTSLLVNSRKGDKQAEADLIHLVYDELRKMAAYYLKRERSEHTLQPTALVNEVYMKLIEQTKIEWKDRAHFFGTAAHLMRQILVDYARNHNRAKRGSGVKRLSLDEAIGFTKMPDLDLVALDDALTTLATIDSQQSRIVELRFFGGLSIDETAAELGISATTVSREWTMAKARLHREISKREQDVKPE